MGTPPAKQVVDEVGSRQGGRRRVVATSGTAGETGMEVERLSAADLAAKKMLLPFLNKLSLIEIALEEVIAVLRNACVQGGLNGRVTMIVYAELPEKKIVLSGTAIRANEDGESLKKKRRTSLSDDSC